MEAMLKIYSILRIISPLIISLSVFAATDEDLTNLIQNALRANATTAQSKVDIKTAGGVVNLSGNVTDTREANDAIKIANSFPGVADVNATALTVNNKTVPNDEYIIAKVKGAFIREKLFGDDSVNVNTIQVSARNGIVSLSGVADSQDEINKAVDITKQVVGVTNVQSAINLK